MSNLRLILNSLRHHARLNVAVGLGVVVAAAVLTGALLVGDSVRGSLKHLTLDRLGRIDSVLVVNRFFRQELAAELSARPEFSQSFQTALPAIVLQGSVERAGDDGQARAGAVTLLGVEAGFWKLGERPLEIALAANEVVLNQPLADELALMVEGRTQSIQPGDEVVLRFPRASAVPEESSLGRKTETVNSRRVTVKAIIPAEGLGRFGLHPNQQSPRNAYVDIATLQTALDQRGGANAIFVAGEDVATAPSAQIDEQLNSWLQPKLADYNLSIERVVLKPDENDDHPERAYFNLTSQRMLLEDTVAEAAKKAFADLDAQPTLTYLANYIAAGDEDKAKIPYSTVTALDFAAEPPLGPFLDLEGQPLPALKEGEIALNRWAAEDMAAQGVKLQPGDGIRLTFFEPESSHGTTTERTVTLKLAAIVDMRGPAVDAHFTPEVKGITDQDSINDWDPPFPFDAGRVRSRPPNTQDEDYWDKYQATPKAFVSLRTGRDLWRSRFGQSTTVRIPAGDGLTAENLADRLLRQLDPASLGYEFRPVKRLGLQAATGATPFNLLFLGFSTFIIAAAVMLVALLFRLGCDQRASEVGILEAVGLSQRQVRRLLGWEGLLVAAVGGLLGVGLGVGHAWLMLAALRSPDWWLAAVSTPFLQLHIAPTSLLIGYFSGVLVSLAAIAAAVWRMGRQSVRSLLAGQPQGEGAALARPPRYSRWILWISLPLALGIGVAALNLVGEAQAGAFFGSGFLVLTACLAWLWGRLRGGGTGSLVEVGGFPLARLAARNGARNPGRSTLTIGLVSAATFLIVAISAFRLEPASDVPQKTSGNGGFALVGESEPVFQDLNTAAGRADLGVPPAAAKLLEQSLVVPLRVQGGDDASCLNLYQTTRPRVLGVPDSLIERGGFAWGGTLAETEAEQQNPWMLLRKDFSKEGVTGESAALVPAILDANTAMYGLHKGLGDTLEIEDEQGRHIGAKIVGLLKNSLFQGDLLVGERSFLRLYPGIGGARFFLVETPPAEMAAVERALETSLGDFGFHAERSSQRLAEFMAVQNTYLETFQSLGGLGLLLGTFGLATVQLRNVLERRGELALLRAAGFRRSKLARLVMIENSLLLVAGLGIGVVAALVAILPHLVVSGRASIPWEWLALTLGLVLVTGLAAGLLAVRATLKAPLLPALRGE